VEVELNFTGQMVRPPPSEVSENYPKEVEWMDRYLGELRSLLESRGIEERTLWVLVSDHGEGLYRHNHLGHATFVLEDQLRLLLQVRGPGVPEGRVVEQPAVMMDVAPTILDLVGLPIPSEVEGRSLVGCWDGGSCPDRDRWWAYGYNHRTRRLASIAEYQWPYKYIWKRGSGKRVFNLDRDPEEDNNLIDVRPHPKEVLELSRRFHRQRPKLAWILNHRQRRIQHKDSLELLKSLGYIGDTGSDPGK
jgi:arylsulfatase A-like enzyme